MKPMSAPSGTWRIVRASALGGGDSGAEPQALRRASRARASRGRAWPGMAIDMVRSLCRASGGGDAQKGIGQMMGGGDQGFGAKVKGDYGVRFQGFRHGPLPAAHH